MARALDIIDEAIAGVAGRSRERRSHHTTGVSRPTRMWSP